MKKYIFLTFSITGLSGNPRYVNNKCRWLKQQGWEVMVFWHNDLVDVQLEHVLPFKDKEYIIHELGYYPCWFSNHKRNAVINMIAQRIGTAEEIVIESNTLPLGAWGELLAKQIKAKHINFVTTEKVKISNQSTFDYCYEKLKRNEFFTINEEAVNLFFSNFIALPNPKDYYWSAIMGVDVDNIDFPAFDNLPNADFTIVHFGRTKGYFPYMISDLKSFFSRYSNKTFNLFFVGQVNDVDVYKRELSLPNVQIASYHEVAVVPRQIFTNSDVVIAAAGCAWLSANNGGKTISMDVNRNRPLGLLCYTTLDSNTYSGKYDNHKSLSEWLQALLIDKVEYNKMELSNELHDFTYQMQFVSLPDGFYVDTTRVYEGKTANDRVLIILCKLGLFKLVDWLYFSRKKRKKSK